MSAHIIVKPAGAILRTFCGRDGCGQELGGIAGIDVAGPGIVESGTADLWAGRAHLLEPHWHLDALGRWVAGRKRGNRRASFRVGNDKVKLPGQRVVAVPPDALIVCPRCGWIQTLPEGTAHDLGHFSGVRCEVDASRLRPTDWR